VTSASHRIVKLAPGFDLRAFDCGEPAYNEWLVHHAAGAIESGSAAVHLLVETSLDPDRAERVVGYFAICPTLVVRDDAPKQVRRGLLRSAPGWLLAKLALDRSLRGDPDHQWGRQLLREALVTIIAAAEVGGGQVIVVDPDNAGLVSWYAANGFFSTGGPDLRMYLKVATARGYLR
jgi:ribosomal protein S18 acetylase RimI-like enzyme